MPGGFVKEVCTNHGLVRLAEGESVGVLSFSRHHVEDALRISRRHRGVSSTDGLPFLGSHTVYECWLKRNDRSCSMTLLIVLSRVVRLFVLYVRRLPLPSESLTLTGAAQATYATHKVSD